MIPHQALPPYDWHALLSLVRRAFAGMEGRIDPPSSMHALTVEAIAEQSIQGEIWVIGQPARACVFVTPKAGSLYLHKLATDPAFHRQGLARSLIDTASHRARAHGLHALTLSTRIELTQNHAAFRAMGFIETGRSAHPGFARPTTLHFTLPLIGDTA